jgi:hypothetical protein
MGLDLGQRRDHTAVAVVERAEPGYARVATGRLVIRHLQRAPLGTGYPAVVEAVREAIGSDELRGQCCLAVDATGLGGPVVDMLRGAQLGCDLTAVTITGGDRQVQKGMNWSVPKRDLMAGVQVLLERGDLRIASGIEMAGALVKELMNARMSGKGTEHDDLVLAVSLAVWRARGNSRVGERPGRLI